MPRTRPRAAHVSGEQLTIHGARALRSDRQVCAAAKCSVYYTKRICVDCLRRPEIAAQMPAAPTTGGAKVAAP